MIKISELQPEVNSKPMLPLAEDLLEIEDDLVDKIYRQTA
jgi:hypothetical protein